MYINWISEDAPPPLTLGTAASGQAGTSTTASPAPTAAAGPTATTARAAVPALTGNWRPTSASVLGYRVKEVLLEQSKEAVGRTTEISGSMTLDGAVVSAVDLTVDLRTVSSDSSQRDGQFQGRIMNTASFPNATFKLTQPLTLSAVPNDDSVVEAKATGDLTLRGTTRTVTFDLKAQRDGANIKVNGSIPVVFADYNIPNPSTPTARTEDNGVLEFLVVFAKA